MLPIRLLRDKVTRSLSIETFPQSQAQVLLSADGDPVFLMPNGSGVFFLRDGALYFAPIVSAPTPNNSGNVPITNKSKQNRPHQPPPNQVTEQRIPPQAPSPNT